jgi:hypothetical protein
MFNNSIVQKIDSKKPLDFMLFNKDEVEIYKFYPNKKLKKIIENHGLIF